MLSIVVAKPRNTPRRNPLENGNPAGCNRNRNLNRKGRKRVTSVKLIKMSAKYVQLLFGPGAHGDGWQLTPSLVSPPVKLHWQYWQAGRLAGWLAGRHYRQDGRADRKGPRPLSERPLSSSLIRPTGLCHIFNFDIRTKLVLPGYGLDPSKLPGPGEYQLVARNLCGVPATPVNSSRGLSLMCIWHLWNENLGKWFGFIANLSSDLCRFTWVPNAK